MSRVVRKNKIWLIPLCLVIVGLASLYGWRTYAQDMVSPVGDPNSNSGGMGLGAPSQEAMQQAMPATPAPGGVAPPAAAAGPSEPTVPFGSVIQGGVTVSRTKNWDGTVTEFVKFKHKTLDKRVLTVLLPATYRKDKMTRAGWDTLFQVYDMGYEYQLDAVESARVPDLESFRNQLMREIRGLVPEGSFENPNPAEGAMESLRMNIPSLSGGSIELPPLLPGMM